MKILKNKWTKGIAIIIGAYLIICLISFMYLSLFTDKGKCAFFYYQKSCQKLEQERLDNFWGNIPESERDKYGIPAFLGPVMPQYTFGGKVFLFFTSPYILVTEDYKLFFKVRNWYRETISYTTK